MNSQSTFYKSCVFSAQALISVGIRIAPDTQQTAPTAALLAVLKRTLLTLLVGMAIFVAGASPDELPMPLPQEILRAATSILITVICCGQIYIRSKAFDHALLTTNQKQRESATPWSRPIYTCTIPGAEDAPCSLAVQPPRLSVSLPDLLLECCGISLRTGDEVSRMQWLADCLRFLATLAATERVQDFFDGPVNPQDAATNGAAYLPASFSNNWFEIWNLEKEGRSAEIIPI